MISENPVYAVILAGGQGTRLWPISRKAYPKQFLHLTGNGSSMLQETVRRALVLTGSIQQVLILTQAAHIRLVNEQVPDLPEENVLIEPVGRNTAACLGLAAVQLSQSIDSQQPGQAVMVSLPVDHLFLDEEPWFLAVRTAIAAATRTDDLVAIGVRPDFPSSAYGYQQLGNQADLGLTLPVHTLRKFIEKPSASMAKTFIESGEYLWNTGTYAWKVDTFLAALKVHAIDLYKGLNSLGHPIDRVKLAQVYPGFEDVSVDHAVMEKAANSLTVQAGFKRIDVGTLTSLAEILPKDEDGNACLGSVMIQDSQHNIAYVDEGLAVLVGVKDLIVVRAGNVVLVCPKDRAHEIKKIVAVLPKEGKEKFL